MSAAEDIARRLTKAQQSALVPFTTFSDRTGAELKRLGLLQKDDGVWTHTALGSEVRKLLRTRTSGASQ